MLLAQFNCTVRYFVLQGMPYSPVKFTGALDAQCLQGMPYSPVKFTGAPDAQCLQGMPYSLVKFTEAPDTQCLQGMLYSLVKFTEAPDAQCLQDMPSPMHRLSHQVVCCVLHIQTSSKAVYHICSEMYHEVLGLLQTVLIVVCCVLHGWSEHHTAKKVLIVAPIHTNFGCDHHSPFLTVKLWVTIKSGVHD